MSKNESQGAMMNPGSTLRSIIVITTAIIAACNSAWAQEAATTPAAPAAQVIAVAEDFDSRNTREELYELLSRHPREVGVLLKLDPSLFENEVWISSYPLLRDFVAKHPEVPLNTAYYLERVWVSGDHEPEPAAVRMARQTIEGASVFVVFMSVVGVLAWLIRTLLEYRKWSRISRVQTEIYNKLLDRFTSHEDLLAYVQSTAGKDFIQSAASPMNAGGSPSIAAPIGRILWSMQAGVILFAIGVGLQIVSRNLHPDVAASMSTMGVLALCGGIGFALSAVVAWVFSRKLGILPAPEVEAETGQSVGRTLGE